MRIPKTCTWYSKKLFALRDLINGPQGWTNLMDIRGDFAIHKCYKMLIGHHDKPSWRHLLYCNIASPRAKFIMWLAMQGRLYTMDRVCKWQSDADSRCCLCNGNVENVQHLFFECD